VEGEWKLTEMDGSMQGGGRSADNTVEPVQGGGAFARCGSITFLNPRSGYKRVW
jgi:hypothetical protein